MLNLQTNKINLFTLKKFFFFFKFIICKLNLNKEVINNYDSFLLNMKIAKKRLKKYKTYNFFKYSIYGYRKIIFFKNFIQINKFLIKIKKTCLIETVSYKLYFNTERFLSFASLNNVSKINNNYSSLLLKKIKKFKKKKFFLKNYDFFKKKKLYKNKYTKTKVFNYYYLTNIYTQINNTKHVNNSRKTEILNIVFNTYNYKTIN